MAAETKRPPPSEEVVADAASSLQRLAELTRRVLEVPKGEVPALFTKPKKKRKRKRGH